MGLGDKQRKQLAAKAIRRKLDRVSSEVSGVVASHETDALSRQHSPVPAEFESLCRFETMPGYQQVAIMRQMRERLGIESPFFRVHEGMAGATTQIGGRTYINFANYNYLGLACSPDANARPKAALGQYGTSASASRMVAGERPIQAELETALANPYEAHD